MPFSCRMRASVGNAVMDMAAPRYSAAAPGVTWGANRSASPRSVRAATAPSASGAAIPAPETREAWRTRPRSSRWLNSMPTMNM